MSTEPMSVVRSSPNPLLQATDVSVRFGGVQALSNVSIEINSREVVGLIGPNGAGKSTLLNVLTGYVAPTDGTVMYGLRNITRTSAHRRAQLGISRTFQHPETFDSLTVREHFLLAHRARHNPRRLWTEALTLGIGSRRSNAEARAIGQLLERLELEAVSDEVPVHLPLGTQRVVDIGRALAYDPEVLLMDEPGSGLDLSARRDIEQIIREIPGERGRAVVIVEHDVDLILSLCDRVYVLHFGHPLAAGTPDEIRSNLEVQNAYLGQSTATRQEAP